MIMLKDKRIVISLGGSLVVPREIDTVFLKKFKHFVTLHIKGGWRFIIVVGGGNTARCYQHSAKETTQLHRDDLDWLGIHATRINAHLLRTIFKDSAYPKVVTNPRIREGKSYKVIIASGWKPGWSTDYIAVRLAKTYQTKMICNLSNIDYVYTDDPRNNKKAKPIERIDWKSFRKLVGNKWDPGAHLPFDPVASRLAEELKLQVCIVHGRNLSNFSNFLHNRKFRGTLIGG